MNEKAIKRESEKAKRQMSRGCRFHLRVSPVTQRPVCSTLFSLSRLIAFSLSRLIAFSLDRFLA